MKKNRVQKPGKMSKHLTFDDLNEGFPEFKERFQRAKHEPFCDAHIIKESDFVARIVLAPRNWDWFQERGTYTYYITKTGAIKFRAPALFPKQPKMKWANIIERWLQASIPLYRQLERMDKIKLDLLTASTVSTAALKPADNADDLMEFL